jgi:hypothetical protein
MASLDGSAVLPEESEGKHLYIQIHLLAGSLLIGMRGSLSMRE